MFLKGYKLRYLFYRSSNLYREDLYVSETICFYCHKPALSYIMFGKRDYCINCREGLVLIENKTWQRRYYLTLRWLDKHTEKTLDYLHILRKPYHSRYGDFGDETSYRRTTVDFSKPLWSVTTKKIPRKWWEYIFIKTNP